MNRQEFLCLLREELRGLPQDDINERVIFYSEMIDDLVEEGFSEEDAVNSLGNTDEIISQIVTEVPLTKLVKEKTTPKKNLEWRTITLLILGSPIWLSLLIAAVAVVLSLYAAAWCVIISLWSVFASVTGSVIGTVFASIMAFIKGNSTSGIAMIGAAVACAGLSILLFFGCKATTKGFLLFIKKAMLKIKNSLRRKEQI